MPPKRIVIDTNVLVGSAYAPGSASHKILDGCLRGEWQMLVSQSMRSEYENVLGRAVQGKRDTNRIWQAIEQAEPITPSETPAVVQEDPSDDKFLAAAVAGKADVLVTNDRFVLNHDPHLGVRIVRPSVFLIIVSG